MDVDARTLHGPELEAAWKRFADEAREYAAYLHKTDCEIPIVRLQRR